jgi:hypothetical protein
MCCRYLLRMAGRYWHLLATQMAGAAGKWNRMMMTMACGGSTLIFECHHMCACAFDSLFESPVIHCAVSDWRWWPHPGRPAAVCAPPSWWGPSMNVCVVHASKALYGFLSAAGGGFTQADLQASGEWAAAALESMQCPTGPDATHAGEGGVDRCS